jgi:hypothetical protein
MLAGDGDDHRRLPLSLRKANLDRLLSRQVAGIFMADYEQGDIGHDLFHAACCMGLEGIVSKHRGRAYHSGRCKHQQGCRPALGCSALSGSIQARRCGRGNFHFLFFQKVDGVVRNRLARPRWGGRRVDGRAPAARFVGCSLVAVGTPHSGPQKVPAQGGEAGID